MLQFVNWSLLLGAFGAALPILIHLLARRRRQRIPFSSLRFFKQLEPRTLHWLRVRQRWLLFLRTLLILFVAMALGLPFWRKSQSAGRPGRQRVLIALDNSISMKATGRWESALEYVGNMLASLNAQDEALLFLHDGNRVSRRVVTPGSWPALAAALTPEWHQEDMAGVLETALKWAEKEAPLPWEILLVSDFQNSRWPLTWECPSSDNVSVIYACRAGSDLFNSSVGDLHLDSQVWMPGNDLSFSASFVNHGTESIPARLLRAASPEPFAQTQLSPAPGGSANWHFEMRDPQPGWQPIRVSAEPDDFPWDDESGLAVKIPVRQRVLLITGDRAQSRSVEAALRSLGLNRAEDLVVAAAYDPWMPLLSDVQSIICHQVNSLPAGAMAALKQFVGQGGGLWWIPGSNTDLRWWQSHFFDAWGLGRLQGRLQGGRGFLTVHPSGVHSALKAGLDDEARMILRQVKIRQMLRLQLPSATVLIRCDNDLPWMTEHVLDQGRIWISASDVEEPWSNVSGSAFLPFWVERTLNRMNRMGLMVVDAISCGDVLNFPVSGEFDVQTLTLTRPGGEVLSPEWALNGHILECPQIRAGEPGIYRVASGAQTVSLRPVSVPTSERNLLMAETGAIKKSFDSLPVRMASEPDALPDLLSATRRGVDISPWLWFAVMLLMSTEMVVAREQHRKQ